MKREFAKRDEMILLNKHQFYVLQSSLTKMLLLNQNYDFNFAKFTFEQKNEEIPLMTYEEIDAKLKELKIEPIDLMKMFEEDSIEGSYTHKFGDTGIFYNLLTLFSIYYNRFP